MLPNFEKYPQESRVQKIANFLRDSNSLYFEKETTLYWLPRLLADDTWRNIRFKCLKDAVNYQYNIPDFMIDSVSENEFQEKESERIPLFIGSQFGYKPNLESTLTPNDKQIVAILAKSVLSGTVFWLSIHRYSNKQRQLIKLFENDNILKLDSENFTI